MLENEKIKLIDITQRINEWQNKNDQLILTIDKVKLMNLKIIELANDVKHKRDEKFHRGKLKAIMLRNRLITKLQNNYEDLVNLRSQLELLRLKTYPTLRLKEINKTKSEEN